jgi:luciferase-type oxidoreductase
MKNETSMPPAASPPAASGLFRQGALGIGLTLPLQPRGEANVDYAAQLELAARADALGFQSLWVRDVPLNSGDYPDPVGHLDPWVLLGALAACTRRITLVSGAIVATLRHPLHVAKGAVSVASLSGGRFVLGLGSGDRPAEFAAFGADASQRRRLFATRWERIAAALADPSRIEPDLPGEAHDDFALLPSAPAPVPMFAVGSGGQSVDWIARHAVGWMTYHREPSIQRDRHRLWRLAVERAVPGQFRGFGVSMRLELSDVRGEAPTPIPLGYRTGSRGLVSLLQEMADGGTHHVAFALADAARPVADMLEELAADVLPAFAATAV